MKKSSNAVAYLVCMSVSCASGERDDDKNTTTEAKKETSLKVTSSETPQTRCANCHLPEFLGANHPLHPGARPQTCGVCHGASDWHRIEVRHPTWELTGAHARAAADPRLAGDEKQVKCFWCHRGSPTIFEGTPKSCVSCHEFERARVKFERHATFSSECATCHSTDAWKPARHPPEDARPGGSVAPVPEAEPDEPAVPKENLGAPSGKRKGVKPKASGTRTSGNAPPPRGQVGASQTPPPPAPAAAPEPPLPEVDVTSAASRHK